MWSGICVLRMTISVDEACLQNLGIHVFIHNKTTCPSLDFVDARDVLATVWVSCTCILYIQWWLGSLPWESFLILIATNFGYFLRKPSTLFALTLMSMCFSQPRLLCEVTTKGPRYFAKVTVSSLLILTGYINNNTVIASVSGPLLSYDYVNGKRWKSTDYSQKSNKI